MELAPPIAVPTSPVPGQAPVSAATADSEWAIVKVTSVGHFLCHLGELIFPGAMLAIKDEMQLSPAQTTDLAVLGYALMGAGALPVGWWSDAWDSRRILLIYFFAMAAAGLAVAVAPTPWLLFAALTLLGLATSMYHPAGLAMISLGVSRHGRAMGINGVAGSLGIALGPALGMAFGAAGFWQGAYLVLAGLSLLGGLLAIWDLRRIPALAHKPPTHSHAEASQMPASSSSMRALLPLALLLLVMMFAGFLYRCLMTALPGFLSGGTESFKIAAYVFAITLVGGSLGQLVGGYLADRFGSRKVYLYLVSALAPLSSLLGWLSTNDLAAVAAVLLAVAMFAQQPVENSLLAESTSRGRRSITYGVKFVLTFGVGALGAAVVGLIWEEYGSFDPVFYLMAGVACLMAILMKMFLSLSSDSAPASRAA